MTGVCGLMSEEFSSNSLAPGVRPSPTLSDEPAITSPLLVPMCSVPEMIVVAPA